MDDLIRWSVGLVGVSLVLGHFFTRALVTVLNRKIPVVAGPWKEIPTWLRKTLIGLVERTFFTVAIAVGLSGTAVAMIGWTALKGTLYWASYKEAHPANVLIALIGSLVSLLFAVLGALICNGELWNWIFG
jgi:hypothetical protein